MEYRIHRKATDFEVFLTTRTGAVRAQVKNVHPHGARLRFSPGEIDLFSTIVVDFKDQSHAAEVMWIHENEIGIRFAKPLQLETVAMIARRIGGASRERIVRDLASVRTGNQVHPHLSE